MHLKMHDPPPGKRYVFNEKGQPVYIMKDGKFELLLEDAPAPAPAPEPELEAPKPKKRKGG